MTDPEVDHQTGKPRVLRISEMMMQVDGVYFGEIGNPSYVPRSDRFEYHPAIGLEVHGDRDQATTLGLNDVVELPQHLGALPVRELLGQDERVLSDKEFSGAISEAWRGWREQVGKVDTLAKLVSHNNNVGEFEGTYGAEFGRYRHMAHEEHPGRPQHPGDVVEAALRVLDEERPEQTSSLAEAVKRTGVLSNDPEDIRRGIVAYFYVFGEAGGFDLSTNAGTKDALDQFPNYRDLVDEYERQPDGRFGDTLMLAVEQSEAIESQN